MRTYGRKNENGVPTWVEVSSDPIDGDDYVWITTLIQTLKLNINESPFFSNYGIPAQPSVVQQVFPDFYVAQTQTQFARHFASLIVSKLDAPSPTYQVNVTTHQGTRITAQVAT
tara:strand:+ start:217 stop:558 length:342 start_codon:yes stop_codon:yes gene_type:complete